MVEERLAGLALMNVHSYIAIDIDEILKMFVELYLRKMFKKFLFIDEYFFLIRLKNNNEFCSYCFVRN